MQVIVCVLILRVLFLVAYVKHILFNTTHAAFTLFGYNKNAKSKAAV